MKRAISGCLLMLLVLFVLFISSASADPIYGAVISFPDGIVSIEEQAFYGDESITVILIPEGTQTIGKQAFANCRNLYSILIPSSVTSIADDAFDGCSSKLTIRTSSDNTYAAAYARRMGIQINNLAKCGDTAVWFFSAGELTISGTGAVYDYTVHNPAPWNEFKDQITKVYVGEGITSIGKDAFYDCGTINTVSLPDSVSYIGEYAFYGCEELIDIQIPNQLTKINKGTFAGCRKLPSVNIPESVTDIDTYAFIGCSSLNSLIIPKNTKSIGNMAFSQCSNIETAVVLSNVSSIGSNAFYLCDKICMYVEENSNAYQYCLANNIPFYLYDSKNDLSVFQADAIYYVIGLSTPLFTVKTLSSMPVYLLSETDEVLGQFNDEGIDGDIVANDGVYSFALENYGERARIARYCATNQVNRTESLTIYFFEDASNNTAKTEQDIHYINQYIEKANDDMSSAEQYANQLLSNGYILEYNVDSYTTLSMKTKYGLNIVFTAKSEVTSGSGDTTKIYVFTPSYSEFKARTYPESSVCADYPAVAMRILDDVFESFDSSGIYSDSGVTLNSINALGPDSVVLWDGHGGYSAYGGPFIATGEDWNITAFFSHLDDYLNGWLLETSSGKIAVNGGYIKKHCGSLSNSFIYLSTCESGHSSELANAFIQKGAKAVVANTNTIKTVYTQKMLRSVIVYMSMINNTTGNYFTLYEALQAAFKDNGNNDGYLYKAYPRIFGGTAAQNYRFKFKTSEPESEPPVEDGLKAWIKLDFISNNSSKWTIKLTGYSGSITKFDVIIYGNKNGHQFVYKSTDFLDYDDPSRFDSGTYSYTIDSELGYAYPIVEVRIEDSSGNKALASRYTGWSMFVNEEQTTIEYDHEYRPFGYDNVDW